MTKAVLVAGLGFGDEGKGTITEYLAEELHANLVVRYNGGPQAAHNVVLRDGRHHTFAQFGSATLQGVRSHLSRFMLVEPHALLSEGRHILQLGFPDPYPLLTIDREALMVTPYHWFANRLRELSRGGGRHGSCGVGVGETTNYSLKYDKDAPRMKDLEDPTVLRKKFGLVQERLFAEFKDEFTDRRDATDLNGAIAMGRAFKRIQDPVDHVVESYAGLTDIFNLVDCDFLAHTMKDATTIFEGAQGVLLDQDYGFHPYNTWTNITFDNALALMRDFHDMPMEVTRIGVMRTYMTRHGEGPLPTEKNYGVTLTLDKHNTLGLWQGPLRIGELDLPLVKYSLDVLGGVDEIAMTHLDQRREFEVYCDRYEDILHPDDYVDSKTGFLKVKKPADYAHLLNVTLGLKTKWINPRFVDSPFEHEDFVDEVSARLRTPIKILSDGPRYCDKWRL